MKRKLLAAIMLIVLAFGVMAFAACDDSGTLKINSYGDGCADSPVKISVEAKKEYLVDEAYTVKIEYGTAVPVTCADEFDGFLFVYNYYGDYVSGVENILALESLLKVSDFGGESDRVYEEENGKNYKFNKSAEVEIPKAYVQGSEGSIVLLFMQLYMPENSDSYEKHGYMGAHVTLNYKVKDGKVYFSKG